MGVGKEEGSGEKGERHTFTKLLPSFYKILPVN